MWNLIVVFYLTALIKTWFYESFFFNVLTAFEIEWNYFFKREKWKSSLGVQWRLRGFQKVHVSRALCTTTVSLFLYSVSLVLAQFFSSCLGSCSGFSSCSFDLQSNSTNAEILWKMQITVEAMVCKYLNPYFFTKEHRKHMKLCSCQKV